MKKLLILLLCAVMLLTAVSCSKKQDDNDDNSSLKEIIDNQDDDTVLEDENDSEDDENKDDLFVLDHFSGGVIIDKPDGIKVRFEISDLKTTEEGLVGYYTISRESSGYVNSYGMGNLKINGCNVDNIEYYADDILQKEMGKNNTENEDAQLKFVIPKSEYDKFGISEIESFSFSLGVGHSAYNTYTPDYGCDVVIYPGEVVETQRFTLPYNENYITLAENEYCNIVITDIKWSGKPEDIDGQKLKMFIQTYEAGVYVTFEQLKIGDITTEIEENTIGEHTSNNFYVDEDSTYMVDAFWLEYKEDLSQLPYNEAELTLKLRYGEWGGETLGEETFTLPLDLDVEKVFD